ncbi:MAG: hypothetical protein OEO77_12250, partial [Acidimicrobiia bacterium]|nr:hypothetical protein [Acidimicrobiia bacterium]
MRRIDGLIVAEVLVVTALHKLPLRLPSADMKGWLDSGPPDVLVMGALRLIGLVLAYWMLASTVAYLVARLSGIPRAIAAIEWATL